MKPPSVALALPQLRVRAGVDETISDLTSHPWAGETVRLTLVARDEGEQVGVSESQEIVLPARQFTNPVARALVEQRRALLLDANQAEHVETVLETLALAQQREDDPAGQPSGLGHYLALRAAYHRLTNARNDEALREAADFLWAVALGFEDGDLSLAQQALLEAEDGLLRAFRQGASEADLDSSRDAVGEAMQRYHDALAEQRPNGKSQGAGEPSSLEADPLRELESMAGGIEELAAGGAHDAAQDLRNQLQQAMEALRAERTQPSQPGENPMGDAGGQLGELMRLQQQLMDETFQLNSQPGTSPMSIDEVEEYLRSLHEGQPGQQQMNRQYPMSEEGIHETLRRFGESQRVRQGELQELQRGQTALEQALRDLQAELKAQGAGPSDLLDGAGQEMSLAASHLGEGRSSSALGSQQAALATLLQGAKALAGQPGAAGDRADEAPPGNDDPLGRPQRTQGIDLGSRIALPYAVDTQRARQILDAIRQRLSDPQRPTIEREYLERLLDAY